MASVLMGTFVSGAATSYLFNRPAFNKAGIALLIRGGLLSTTLLASSAITAIAATKILTGASPGDVVDDDRALPNTYILIGSGLASKAIYSVVAKVLMNKYNFPISTLESFAHFGISFLGIYAAYKINRH